MLENRTMVSVVPHPVDLCSSRDLADFSVDTILPVHNKAGRGFEMDLGYCLFCFGKISLRFTDRTY